jgi:DNA-directed RNA polymerase subunit E'/Rpb7
MEEMKENFISADHNEDNAYYGLTSICRSKISKTRVGFSSVEITQASRENQSFDTIISDLILTQLKTDYEGRCIGEGFVMPDTVKIIDRGKISFPHEALQLFYSMEVEYEYVVCNPNPGTIISCKIASKNKIGVLACLVEDVSPLIILIPNDLCDTELKKGKLAEVSENDIIKIMVLGKKFEQNDKKITVIAEIV